MIQSFRIQKVSFVDPKKAKEVRRQFDNQISFDFKDHAMRMTISDKQNYNHEEEAALPPDLHTYQTHHILPVRLGGTNHFSNLAWVHPKLHRDIHDYINWQIDGMQMDESRTIKIPVNYGVIWTLKRPSND